MSKRMELFLVVSLVIVGVFTRLIPHPANFTALGALALWSTTLFPRRSWALAIPLGILVLSDMILGFHSTMLWVYGTFALIAFASFWIQPKVSWTRAISGSLCASLFFFVVTNFGVWLVDGLYPMTAEGLANCYVMALPFLKNQIAGDLFFTVLIGALIKVLHSVRVSGAETSVHGS